MTTKANQRGRHRPQLISVTEVAARLDISTRTPADAWLLARLRSSRELLKP